MYVITFSFRNAISKTKCELLDQVINGFWVNENMEWTDQPSDAVYYILPHMIREIKKMKKKKIYRAGLIPYFIDSDNTIQMLFMLPFDERYGGNALQCIKGRVEDQEEPLDAAIREAREESGLLPSNIDGIPHHLGTFLGRTDMYVAKVRDPNMFDDPTTPEEVAYTQWLTPEEFDMYGRELHKPIVRAAVEYIKRKENLK